MDTNTLIFTAHCVKRLFERGITKFEVRLVIEQGEVIETYPDDYPLPSKLLHLMLENRPLHVVIAWDDSNDHCYVVTAYEPDLTLWLGDFKTRRKP